MDAFFFYQLGMNHCVGMFSWNNVNGNPFMTIPLFIFDILVSIQLQKFRKLISSLNPLSQNIEKKIGIKNYGSSEAS